MLFPIIEHCFLAGTIIISQCVWLQGLVVAWQGQGHTQQTRPTMTMYMYSTARRHVPPSDDDTSNYQVRPLATPGDYF